MLRRFSMLVFVLAVMIPAFTIPVRAGRAIVDLHKLDGSFALFARDSNVPWRPAAVRLDTYSSAAVDFAVYAVDPARVLTAGANTQPRAVDTRGLHPIATWTFTPPGGYRFQSNDVSVPLGSREGFFVVQARCGGVSEQVWIDRTRVGLIAKETPNEILLYAADLGSGRALPHLRVSFISGGRFVVRYTGKDGAVRWRGNPRPVFAFAQWGASTSFISFLPQAPLPAAIVGLRVDSAVVRAGDTLHVVGFARTRRGAQLTPARGRVALSLRSGSQVVAQIGGRLDAAGAFDAALRVPDDARAGEYIVLASADGASTGSAVHVDADPNGVVLSVAAQCGDRCDASRDVPVVVRATRDGKALPNLSVRVSVIRSPHVGIGGSSGARLWGIARWIDRTVKTSPDGTATLEIPAPSDGLSSTYGVHAQAGGATADTRIVVATSPIALNVQPDRTQQGADEPVTFEIAAHRLDSGAPAAGLRVTVQLVHGTSVQQQTITLDADGRARGLFHSPQPGSNLIIAKAAVGTDVAMDAQQVQIEPHAVGAQSAGGDAVAITLDRKSYAPGEPVRASANAAGAAGDALFTLESATGTAFAVVPIVNSGATATFKAVDALGDLAVGAAIVRGGSLQWGGARIDLDAPGRPELPALHLDKPHYPPGATAVARITQTYPEGGTVAVRITKGAPTGSALFDTAPQLLAVGATTTQDTAPRDASWHPWVDANGSHAEIITYTRRTAPPQILALSDARTASIYWKVDRTSGGAIDLPAPRAPGRYTLSVLKIGDDGSVSAASTDLVVE